MLSEIQYTDQLEKTTFELYTCTYTCYVSGFNLWIYSMYCTHIREL